jgi:hypothetical protein
VWKTINMLISVHMCLYHKPTLSKYKLSFKLQHFGVLCSKMRWPLWTIHTYFTYSIRQFLVCGFVFECI